MSTTLDNAEIFAIAWQAARKAAAEAVPSPIVVGTPTTPLGNDIDLNEEVWFVSDGVCGFGWVNIKPARGAFVTYVKKRNLGYSNSYEGGYDINMGSITNSQSLARNEAAALAFAAVLNAAGIKSRAQSRID
jgi:hypothetical protein